MENVNHKAGDWSFIPAGADHDLVSEPGKGSLLCMVRAFYRRKEVRETGKLIYVKAGI